MHRIDIDTANWFILTQLRSDRANCMVPPGTTTLVATQDNVVSRASGVKDINY